MSSTDSSSSDAPKPLNCDEHCDPREPGYCTTQCLTACPKSCRQPPSKRHHSPPFLIVTFSVLSATLLVILCYAIYTKFFSRRRRSREMRRESQIRSHDILDQDQGPALDHPIWYINTVGLQDSVIRAITECKYKRGEGLVEGTECSVCLSEFQDDETLRLLPKCSHAFHVPCIDTWLRSHTNCPMCRAPIMVNDASSESLGVGFGDLGLSEEIIRMETAESTGESNLVSGREITFDDQVRGLESEVFELGVKDGGERSEISGEGSGLQLMRSVSMDSLAASEISLAVASGVLPGEPNMKQVSKSDLVKENGSDANIAPKTSAGENQALLKLASSSSLGRNLASGANSLKRSLSCSGRFLLSGHGRSQRLVLPS